MSQIARSHSSVLSPVSAASDRRAKFRLTDNKMPSMRRLCHVLLHMVHQPDQEVSLVNWMPSPTGYHIPRWSRPASRKWACDSPGRCLWSGREKTQAPTCRSRALRRTRRSRRPWPKVTPVARQASSPSGLGGRIPKHQSCRSRAPCSGSPGRCLLVWEGEYPSTNLPKQSPPQNKAQPPPLAKGNTSGSPGQ